MNRVKRCPVLYVGVAASALLLAQQASAASFTINGTNSSAESPAPGQTLNAGEAGVVEQGGFIRAPAGNGITGAENGVTITNAGSVTGTGAVLSSGLSVLGESTVTNAGAAEGGTFGIVAQGDDNTITNLGTARGGSDGISAQGNANTITNSGMVEGASYGIVLNNGTGNTITNSGRVVGWRAIGAGGSNNTITNSGEAEGGFDGIAASGSDNTVINSGTAKGDNSGINTGGDGHIITNLGTAQGGSTGIFAGGNNQTVSNSGSAVGGIGITASGTDNTITNLGTSRGREYGIFAGDMRNTIINSGTSGGSVYGVFVRGDDTTVTNSGTAQGEIFGIYADGQGNTITNSGLIAGGLGAVSFNGSGNTLKLLEGSVLEGRVLLGDATNTLIIGKGLDTAVEFGGTPTIRTDGVPFVVAGSTVYAVNVSSFSVQDEMTSDLTRAVRGAVEGRLAQARLTGGGLSVAMNGMTIAAAADVSVASRNGLWLSGLAASRDQEQDGNVAAFETALAGAVGGFDGMLTDSTRAGLFGGFTSASLDAEDDALEDLDSGTWFGGAYLGHDWGHTFLDMTLTAGWSAFESRRRVANNIADGGIEHAGADYGGFLISPSVRIGTGMALGSGTFTPSLRLSYAGLFLEGYKESGPAAALDVDARSINILDVRGELAYGFAMGSLYNTLRIGIDGTFNNADDAEATLAGQALDIDVAEHNLVRGFIGYDADYALSDSASLTFAAEAGYDTTKAVTLQALAGLSWAF